MHKKCKKNLDREIEKGYNIEVSPYAIGTLDATEYDETYTEYRVQKLLRRGNNAMRLIKTEEEKNWKKYMHRTMIIQRLYKNTGFKS